VVENGIGQVPEGQEILGHLTVLENLKPGTLHRRDTRHVQRDELPNRQKSLLIFSAWLRTRHFTGWALRGARVAFDARIIRNLLDEILVIAAPVV
jgi:ABC-type branched-subunit amino acid transport system ATPase component